jgi:hypothetical protein
MRIFLNRFNATEPGLLQQCRAPTLPGCFSATPSRYDRHRRCACTRRTTDRANSFDPSAQAALDQLHALGANSDAAFAVVGRTIV